MSSNSVSAVILAAGKGTRMFSSLPKALHLLAGKYIVQYIIDTCETLQLRQINLVHGKDGYLIKSALKKYQINWVYQEKELGTGHAVQKAISYFLDNEDILIIYGDVPLISKDTFNLLIDAKPKYGISLLTAELNNPNGYGRIIRKNGAVVGIVEHNDASEEQRLINEINTGVMVINSSDLKIWLKQIKCNNIHNEFYLTDIIALAYHQNKEIVTVNPININEIKGINNRLQLAEVERIYQRMQAEQLMLSGVTLLDPSRFDLRGVLKCGQDTVIDCNVVIEGDVILGNRVSIGTGCLLKDCKILDDSTIEPYSIIEGSLIASNVKIGPFARLRYGNNISDKVRIGNFVELKETFLGIGSKVNHLSYIGNADIGNNTNIGAGTITCNYDGISKYKTSIGNRVFIGSDSQLIAPINISDKVTIAAGTTVMKDVNSPSLVYNTKKQIVNVNWQHPKDK